MSSENPNLLRSEIHSTSDTGVLGGGTLESRIAALASVYSTGDSQNYHMFTHIIQELNRKLDQFGLANNIVTPIDAGFRPLNFNDFFGDASPSPNLPDYLELEDDSYLFQENGFKLILEQDI
ncbi:MAG: hypothetical protein ACO3HJ_00200 [Methylophilaceae bacterium]